MKIRHFTLITVFVLMFIIVFTGFSCGGDNDKKEETKKASFDGTIDGEETSNEQDSASEGQFGAVIADNTIQIFILPSAASSINIIGKTTETDILPGNLKIDEFVLTVETGIYTYKSGTVHIDKCPSAIGDVFKGTLDVVTENSVDSSTKTVKGEFSVTVYSSANPNLNCAIENDNNDNTAQCGYSAEKCEGGVCCPFIECYEECFMSKCLAICMDSSKFMECLECSSTCQTDTCAKYMTSTCEKAWEKLDECMDENECNGLEDDEDIECAQNHCCSELEGAFKK